LSDIGSREVQRLGAVHLPDRHLARITVPEDIAVAVVVEITGADDVPVGGYLRDIRTGQVQGLRAIHFPDRDTAGVVAPEKIAVAVVVEIAGILDLPIRRPLDMSDIGSRAVQELGAVHFPDRNTAGVVMPENVAVAV